MPASVSLCLSLFPFSLCVTSTLKSERLRKKSGEERAEHGRTVRKILDSVEGGSTEKRQPAEFEDSQFMGAARLEIELEEQEAAEEAAADEGTYPK